MQISDFHLIETKPWKSSRVNLMRGLKAWTKYYKSLKTFLANVSGNILFTEIEL